jgi:hypothetical protein
MTVGMRSRPVKRQTHSVPAESTRRRSRSRWLRVTARFGTVRSADAATVQVEL